MPQEFGNVPPGQRPFVISNTNWRLAYFEALVEKPQDHDSRAFGSIISGYLGLRLISHRDAPTRFADRGTGSTRADRDGAHCDALRRSNGSSRSHRSAH